MTAPRTRSWRLQGWANKSDKKPVYDRVLTSDAQLDRALRALERDPDIAHTAATPA